MKKKLCSILFGLMLLISIFGLVACGEPVKNFNISFIVEGNTYATITTNGNESISIPQNPTKDGFTFDGWFWDNETFKQPFTINSLLDTPINSDMKVYAKFTKNHTHSYTDVITNPTCTEKGFTTHTCSCGDIYKDNYVDALGHDYQETITQPTCTEQGYTTYQCSRCSSNYIDNFANATGHSYSNTWTYDETYHWHTATCEHTSEIKDNAKHNFTNYIYQNDATYESDGTEVATCICGKNGHKNKRK